MKGNTIQFSHLHKSYKMGFLGKKQEAVSDLSFSVPENCIYGFLGANGAGKTTSIKILMGLQFPDRGKVEIFGQAPNSSEAKFRIGYLPERPYFHDSMDAQGFLDFHRALFGKRPSNGKKLSNMDLLKMVGLENLGSKPLKSFSKGMLQRIGIAQSMVNDPSLIIMDEPMSGLDPVGRREIRNLILDLHRMGKTIFFSSHILSDIESICHKIAFLEKGKLKCQGAISEILSIDKQRSEILFRGIDSLELGKNSFLQGAIPSGENFLIYSGSEEETKKIIQEIWEENGTFLSCQKHSITLEDYLFGSKDGEKI